MPNVPKKNFCELFSKLFTALCEQNKGKEDFEKTFHAMKLLIDEYVNSPVIEKDPLKIRIINIKQKFDRYTSLTHEQILKELSPLFIEVQKYLEDMGNNSFFGFFSKHVKSGVDFVFEQNPDLALIGTKQQYSEYVDRIFPHSSVKDIFYHGGKKGIEYFRTKHDVDYRRDDFATDNGIYFALNKKDVSSYTKIFLFKDNSKIIYSVVLDVRNSYKNVKQALRFDKTKKLIDLYTVSDHELSWLKENGYDAIDNIGNNPMPFMVVFNSNQVHILGSNKDMELFRAYKTKMN